MMDVSEELSSGNQEQPAPKGCGVSSEHICVVGFENGETYDRKMS